MQPDVLVVVTVLVSQVDDVDSCIKFGLSEVCEDSIDVDAVLAESELLVGFAFKTDGCEFLLSKGNAAHVITIVAIRANRSHEFLDSLVTESSLELWVFRNDRIVILSVKFAEIVSVKIFYELLISIPVSLCPSVEPIVEILFFSDSFLESGEIKSIEFIILLNGINFVKINSFNEGLKRFPLGFSHVLHASSSVCGN